MDINQAMASSLEPYPAMAPARVYPQVEKMIFFAVFQHTLPIE